MKVLFIGGTGNISTEVSRFCIQRNIDLTLLNRGMTKVEIQGCSQIAADISNFEESKKILENYTWDVVVNWIAFTKEDVLRDIKLFEGKTKQYIFISSASAYEKPPRSPIITESTPLKNSYWQYSRNKIECEEILMTVYREKDFPITIVRPSHTYDKVIPIPIGGWTEYTAIERMKRGEKIIVHGDGSSLWTLTHAKDFAIGFVGLLGNKRAIGETFHITSDESLTWDQIHEVIADAINVKPNIIHIPSDFISRYHEDLRGGLLGDKTHSVIFDNTKIKRYVPEYKAVIPFHQGIIQTLEWFESDKSRMVVKQGTNDLIDKIISDYRHS